jgi:hypothetical protein
VRPLASLVLLLDRAAIIARAPFASGGWRRD